MFQIIYRVSYTFCGKFFVRRLPANLLSDYLEKLIECECEDIDLLMVDVVEV